jgi:hypothetical protein
MAMTVSSAFKPRDKRVQYWSKGAIRKFKSIDGRGFSVQSNR